MNIKRQRLINELKSFYKEGKSKHLPLVFLTMVEIADFNKQHLTIAITPEDFTDVENPWADSKSKY